MKRLALFLALAAALSVSPLRAQEVQPTVIVSEQLDMSSTDTLTTFIFTKDVVVTGTNLKLTCDRLTVVTTRKGDPTATIGKHSRFKSLLAEGHVYILQSDREAACGRAEVLPDDDKIILTDNPVVKDLANGAIATGPKMVLYHGERRAVIEGADNAPSRIVLPAIKDLGFDKEKDKEAKPAAPVTPAAPAADKPKQP
jgi:lipopolysaccharide export system protein LptA